MPLLPYRTPTIFENIEDVSKILIKENKYTIRFIVGSLEKTLTSEDLDNFKINFIEHIKKNDLDIIQ